MPSKTTKDNTTPLAAAQATHADQIVDKILNPKTKQKFFFPKLTQPEVLRLIYSVRAILLKRETPLVKVSAPVKICGDVHVGRDIK